MHENREISWTPWSKDEGRSAKAINRTADMNVQEKSDCAVVPMNQPNNEGLLSAEVGGEGRRLRRTPFNLTCARHRAGQRISQGLRGVRRAVRFPLLPPCIHSKSRMRQTRTYGSVRGASSNRRPYRDN